ncbi:DNA-binding transcriptional LysR family regulator [Nonomuraea soli]|uniref:DNA-binding transcriptional LysR family regulator n=1 Tax=Nonomuraea soli TaxID=1032476 RepID=A0A7W0CCS9_9ACTN|nr:DNA-binding transcriptional LysR family regulator [Nonomuraea soli]
MAERLSFSRAAADLGLSQPAMSQAVTRLEKALAVRLFERNAREVRLTPAGKGLLEHARQVLDSVHALESEAARLARPIIHLAYPSLAGPLAARIARRLANAHPPVVVELHNAGRGAAIAALDSGEASVAIMAIPAPARFVTGARFHVALDRLAVPAGDRLAQPSGGRPPRVPVAGGHPSMPGGRPARTSTPSGRPSVPGLRPPRSSLPGADPVAEGVRPEQLAGRDILLPRNRPPGGAWAKLAERLPGRHRAIAEDLDDFTGALDLVAAGAGLLPIPQLVARTLRRDDVHYVPLEAGELRLTYGVAWLRDQVTPDLLALVKAVQDSLWTR